jgi:hypothetical protein
MTIHGRFRAAALGGILVSLSMLGSPGAAFAASGWSPAVVISPSQPSPSPSAFAIDPSGNELWVVAPPVVGGYAVEVAQRTFGGTWSPQTTIWSVTNRFIATVANISASIGPNNTAAVSWQVGGVVSVALRSSSGVWQAPVTISPTSGSAYNLVAKADSQGNGVAAWSQTTASGSAVDAVTWTASGAFGGATQLSGLSQTELAPDLAVNEAGTAVVDWTAATTFGGTSYQIYSSTRPAGGSWGAATAVSPVMAQGGSTGVVLDGLGDATALWQQGTTIDSSTRPAGGAWSSPAIIETASLVGPSFVASDAPGNVTAVWAVTANGVTSVHAATRPAGSSWGAPVNVGTCSSTCAPILAAARDGSIAVVGWSPGSTLNAAVRLGLGTWTSSVIGSAAPRITNLIAGNNAVASAIWPANIQVKYHVALKQADYR